LAISAYVQTLWGCRYLAISCDARRLLNRLLQDRGNRRPAVLPRCDDGGPSEEPDPWDRSQSGSW